MNKKVLAMAVLAVAFGGISYFAGNSWLESQAQARMNEIEHSRASEAAVETSTVVVAAKQLRFGEVLTPEALKEVAWPANALPEGGFRTVAEAVGNGERKALKTIEPNEPVLMAKVSGEHARAGLAGIIAEGMRAVTIPVDLATGVGGFVMPGDRVDIVLTKRNEEDGEQVARIILENVKVLSIDQESDRSVDGPKVAKSVTLETDSQGAQRLALATSIGRLSLLLRSSGDEDAVSAEALSTDDLDGKVSEAAADAGLSTFLNGPEKKQFATVNVVKREEVVAHSVPVADAPAKDGKKVDGQ